MTKADLVKIICKKSGLAMKESMEIVESLFEIMKKTLEDEEKIKISGFGNFMVREKKARRGRNPKSGQVMTISARRVLTFRPSYILRKALNEKY